MKVHVVMDHSCDELVGVYEDEDDAKKACDEYEQKKGNRPAILSTEICPKCTI